MDGVETIGTHNPIDKTKLVSGGLAAKIQEARGRYVDVG
jgi:hypothetical protein